MLLLTVVVQVLHAEDVFPEGTLLLLVEKVVLDKGLNIVDFHEGVVLLASVS